MSNTELPQYDMLDVCKHDTETDAWMVIEGYVHDITAFLYDHPGGKDILMDHLGKDATTIFNSEKVHAHGAIAYKMLSKYLMLLFP
jgi:4-hydroxysphinganine ceramide fatty acyl 2-hydroxylase